MSQLIDSISIDTDTLDRIARQLKINTDRVLAAIAHEVEVEAKERAPYDTGALEGSIITRRVKQNLYHVQDGVDYGIFQEIGTSRMAAQPFMGPAVEATRKFINKRWGRLFR